MMKRLVIASVAVAGMLLVSTSSSEAGVRFRVGNNIRSFRSVPWGHQHLHRGPVFNGRRSYFHTSPRWRDTGYYDWHPGGFVPHRNHYHYVPGHWHR